MLMPSPLGNLNKRLQKFNQKETQNTDQQKRQAMQRFVNKSKDLRFAEKMHNVQVWKRNQIKYAASSMVPLDNPDQDNKDVDSQQQLQMIDQIENQFNKMQKQGQNNKSGSQSHMFNPKESQFSNHEIDEEFESLPRSKSLSNN